MEVKIDGLEGMVDLLSGLPPAIVSKRGGPVRAALRKAAAVVHKQALANLKLVTANASTADKPNTELLEKNLVVTRGKAPRSGNGERYLVRVRRKVYPGRKGEDIATTLKTAQLLEYGSSKQPAEPWLRPGFQTKARESLDVFERELIKSVDRIVRKLSKGKGGLE
jgi:hypothetical protein